MARHRTVRNQSGRPGPREAARVTGRDPKTQRFRGAIHGLTEKQRAFVRALVYNGGSQADAVRAAGYNSTYPRSMARDLLANDRVARALHEERQWAISGGLANAAIGVLNDLLSDPETPAATRFNAAKFALEMAGHSVDEQQPKEDEASLNRPLAEMTLEELEGIVRDGQRLRDALNPPDQDTAGAVIEQPDEAAGDDSGEPVTGGDGAAEP
ncbi:terminase small subunit [Halorhodospira sp. 9621]|uniref:terminase small subunit n=1 Tax=Halorhodospira sp. 9621 TaxID=2899135 RepID=UPI001EE93884|nr:terminase small subunit [Halorhodospira sp. 9621]MCG5532365.1 terminase small subunit [Halorhodospira sp. 9621]